MFRFTVSERISLSLSLSLSLSTGCRFVAARAIYLSYFPRIDGGGGVVGAAGIRARKCHHESDGRLKPQPTQFVFV